MSSAKNYSPRRKTRHAPSPWSLFSREHQRQLEDEIAFYRDLESAMAKKRLAMNVQEIPRPSTNVSSPQIRGSSGATSAEKCASGPSTNTLAEAPKESSSNLTKETDKNKTSGKSKKQDKPAKTKRSHSDSHKPAQSPAKERTERKSNEAAYKEQHYERNKSPPTTKGTRKVQFAVGTKKGASSPMAYSSSPNSSKDSYIDAPSTPPSTRALKPILKGKGESSGSKDPAMKDRVQPIVTDIDFDDFWSDSSDGASAVDINEIPATIRPRGILKNRNPYARTSIYGVNSSQKSRPHGSSVSQHKSNRGRDPPRALGSRTESRFLRIREGCRAHGGEQMISGMEPMSTRAGPTTPHYRLRLKQKPRITA